jgi:molecular chaperone HscB
MDEKLQPISKSATFFDALGLPRAMKLDKEAIERGFREASKRVHPDRFASAAPEERRLSVDHTVFVNDAYRTLKDPQRRAEYLMSLEGVAVGKEETTIHDPGLLMEMLELQESLEGAPAEKLETMNNELKVRKKALLDRAASWFDEKIGSRDATVTLLHELRFVERLLERIDFKLEEQA